MSSQQSDGPMRIAHLLMVHGWASWDELQVRAAATSADMNVLVDRGEVEGDGHGNWTLTECGRANAWTGNERRDG